MEIYAWSTIWNFFDLTGPQQPPTEKVPCISKKLDFWWSIPQKITIIDYFLYQWWSDHQNKKDFWGNWALEAVEASEVAEVTEVNEAGKHSGTWGYEKSNQKSLKSYYLMLFQLEWAPFDQ